MRIALGASCLSEEPAHLENISYVARVLIIIMPFPCRRFLSCVVCSSEWVFLVCMQSDYFLLRGATAWWYMGIVYNDRCEFTSRTDYSFVSRVYKTYIQVSMMYECGLTETQFWWCPCLRNNSFLLSIKKRGGGTHCYHTFFWLVLSYQFIIADFLPYCHT